MPRSPDPLTEELLPTPAAFGSNNFGISVGDRVCWAKADDDIPKGSEGEVLSITNDGRADVLFSSRVFSLQVASLIKASPTTTPTASSRGETVDDGSQWDFCFVAPLEGKPSFVEMIHLSPSSDAHPAMSRSQEVLAMCASFEALGLETKQYLSVQGDEVYLLVRAPEELLAILAEKSECTLECRPEMLKRYGQEMTKRFAGYRVKPYSIPDTATMAEHGVDTSDLKAPYEHIFLPFVHSHLYYDLYAQRRRFGIHTAGNRSVSHSFASAPVSHGGGGGSVGLPKRHSHPHQNHHTSFFDTTLRLKLVCALIEGAVSDGGAGVDLQLLQERGWSFFPMHTRQERELLNNMWLQDRWVWLGWWQPTLHMRLYFGERVTLYFAFLGSHCRWLLFLGLVGLGVEAVVLQQADTEAKAVGVFSVFVAVWASLFCKMWKRRESSLAKAWGTSDFEHNEQVRLAFKLRHPKKVPSPVDGQLEYEHPSARSQRRRALLSSVTVGLAVLAVLAVNVAVYLLKLFLRQCSVDFLSENADTIFSIALAVAITCCNVAFNALAESLAEFENHRTDTDFRDSKIQKIFFVQVISSYGSLAYCAYLETQLEGGCGEGVRCMAQLSQLVFTILAERFAFTLLFDNVIPRVMAHYRFKRETAGIEGKRPFTHAEEEFILDPYDLKNEIIRRYMDQVIMFGYMVLFVTALPAAPLLGYVSNIIQMHQFGTALLFRKQRNIPFGVQDIGAFQDCFETVAKLAVLSNAGLVFFTMRDVYFAGRSDAFVLWCFFGTQFVIVYLLSVVEAVVNDVPEWVRVQLEREAFLKEELFDLDDVSEAASEVFSEPSEEHLSGAEPHDYTI